MSDGSGHGRPSSVRRSVHHAVNALDMKGRTTGQGICSDSYVGVDFDLGCSTLCMVLPGLMGNWQNGLSSWARWWNTIHQSQQPNPFIRSDAPLCTLPIRSPPPPADSPSLSLLEMEIIRARSKRDT